MIFVKNDFMTRIDLHVHVYVIVMLPYVHELSPDVVVSTMENVLVLAGTVNSMGEGSLRLLPMSFWKMASPTVPVDGQTVTSGNVPAHRDAKKLVPHVVGLMSTLTHVPSGGALLVIVTMSNCEEPKEPGYALGVAPHCGGLLPSLNIRPVTRLWLDVMRQASGAGAVSMAPPGMKVHGGTGAGPPHFLPLPRRHMASLTPSIFMCVVVLRASTRPSILASICVC
jgi:hypothetical protein